MKNVHDFKEKYKSDGIQVSLPDVSWFNDLVSKGMFSPETLPDEIPPKYFNVLLNLRHMGCKVSHSATDF